MLWPIAFIITLVLLLAVAVVCAYLVAQRQALRRERDDLSTKLTAAGDREQKRAQENIQLLTERDAARAKLDGLDDKFRTLAQDVLNQANERFLQLAEQKFQGEQKDAAAQLEQRKQAIEALLKPIREQLDQHAKAVTQIEKEREGAYHGLRQQLGSLLEAQQALGRQTTTLANALSGSHTARGRWGELTLKRLAEMTGMVANCDFDEQVTLWKGDAAQRPDMVVHLPAQRAIVIDAKGVGQNYYAALDATDEPTRRQKMQEHARDIDSRVRELSSKAYNDQLQCTPDFVVLFLPGDSFLGPAVEARPDLVQSALSRGVALATPTSLFTLLRVVELGWREEKIAQNAQRVRDLGVELHERIAVMVGHLGTLGSNLERSVKAYNDLAGSVESRVLVSARKFRDLGADSAKELPAEGEVKDIERLPRPVKPVES